MKRVWFIRHAESEANAGLPSSCPSLIPLTQKGEEQAQTLSDQITEAPGLFIISPYIRTQQTAKPIIEKFPGAPTEIWPIQEYDFLSPAICIDTTVEQRKPMVNDYWQHCQANYVHGEGAESFVLFKTRVTACIKRIEADHHDFIIVFTHGHFIRAAWQYFLTGNTIIDNSLMRNYKDLMISLTIHNTVIFKAGFDGHNWQIQEPLI
jgi:broad specificity phosphatase PhoE